MLTDKQKALLKNRFWRLNHLYKIKDKNGKCVTFKMTPEQLEYFDGMHDRNVILKARQLGFTTEVCIIQLDLAIFHKKECALIAHSLPDAERLFRNKTQFAFQRLPDDIKLANPLIKETTSEYVFAKGGSVTVSTSFRGGTLYSLHVSEFGKICAKWPEKAKEIVTGAFEAVPLGGVITLESTAEGRAGYFYDYCQDAEKASLQGKVLSNLDWKFFFFSWWKNPQYAIDPVEALPQRLVYYFDEMEAKHGVVVNERQKAWYYAKEKTLGDDMKREYPTIPAEAFQQSVEGAYYAKQFRWLYTNKRIGKIPDNSHLPVHTFWDIGVGDSTANRANMKTDEYKITYEATLPGGYDGVQISYVHPTTNNKTYINYRVLSGSIVEQEADNPNKLEIVGFRNEYQARDRALRETKRLIYSRVKMNAKVFEDGIIQVGSVIQMPDIYDSNQQQGYITGRIGNDFETSEPITFTGSMYVLVTDSLGNPTLRYPATARSDTKYGFTAAIPDIQINIWNGDTVQLPSRYLIATVEELDSQLWTVNSIKPNTDNTVSLTVAEYSDNIY